MLKLFPVRAAMLALGVLLSCLSPVLAADLPLAAGSPIAGITFDDRPLMLPVQRNFQMAMLTAGSELGRTCGPMEAYGWRMDQSEQGRVNGIFNNTVDRMRAQGFVVEAKAPTSVSRDITMFTADRPDKHMLFMWSAGEIGLVMVLCETAAPMSAGPAHAMNTQASAATDALRYRMEQPAQPAEPKKHIGRSFSPVGDWVGSYTCTQGTTGATLEVASVRGERFTGMFRFYPTPKNPYVSTGKYAVSGEYDPETARILVNPGKWLQRPKNAPNTTIIIGSFDPARKTFSGFFQGVTGCTSIEARRRGEEELDRPVVREATPKEMKHKVKKARKKLAPRPDKHAGALAPEFTEPSKSPDAGAEAIHIGEQPAALAPAAQPVAPEPATQQQAPMPAPVAPATNAAPVVEPPPVSAPAPAPAPVATPSPAPSAVPAPAPAPTPASGAPLMLSPPTPGEGNAEPQSAPATDQAAPTVEPPAPVFALPPVHGKTEGATP